MQALPQSKNINYNLRKRTHDPTLPMDVNAVMKQNFVFRMLFMDIYWLSFYYFFQLICLDFFSSVSVFQFFFHFILCTAAAAVMDFTITGNVSYVVVDCRQPCLPDCCRTYLEWPAFRCHVCWVVVHSPHSRPICLRSHLPDIQYILDF